MNLKIDAKFEKKSWSVVSKKTRIRWNLTQTLKSIQNMHFHLLLLCKVFNVWPKKVQRSYHDNEEWYKNWRGTDLSFYNWHEEFHKFWPEHSKVFLCHWRVIQILKKNWLVVCKKTWEIWQIFTRALEKVKIGALMGSFCPK